MESDITQSAGFYRAWAWFETYKKQVSWGVGAALVIGIVAWFIVWRQHENEVAAGDALSRVFLAQNMSGGQPDPAAYQKVANQYPNSSAGARAALLAAGAFFVEGKFTEAHAEFSRFIRDHRDHPLLTEALLGIAACLDSQGKTDEAISAYKNLIDHHPDEKNVLPQAKFALARLYEQQKKIELARNLYEDVGRSDSGSSLGTEAGMRFEELKIKYPLATAPAIMSANPAKTNVLQMTNALPTVSPKP